MIGQINYLSIGMLDLGLDATEDHPDVYAAAVEYGGGPNGEYVTLKPFLPAMYEEYIALGVGQVNQAYLEMAHPQLVGQLHGLAGRYSEWFEWKKVEGHSYPYRLIKPEGVEILSGWSKEALDGLSGIGPMKAGIIYKALQKLHQSLFSPAGEDVDTQSSGDSLYLPE